MTVTMVVCKSSSLIVIIACARQPLDTYTYTYLNTYSIS